MQRIVAKARSLTKKKLLVRLDSGHDALENRVLLRKADKVSYIIKGGNPRREDTSELYKRAFTKGQVTEPRPGKRIALLTVRKRQEHDGETYMFTKVIRVTERSTNRHGQLLLAPEVTIEGWWTNLDLPEKKIIAMYQNHGLSEQFHSEFKTDLDCIGHIVSGKECMSHRDCQHRVICEGRHKNVEILALMGCPSYGDPIMSPAMAPIIIIFPYYKRN